MSLLAFFERVLELLIFTSSSQSERVVNYPRANSGHRVQLGSLRCAKNYLARFIANHISLLRHIFATTVVNNPIFICRRHFGVKTRRIGQYLLLAALEGSGDTGSVA